MRAFQGQLTALSLSGSESLRLALERPVDLLAALDHVRIEWLCLVGTPGSVCADGEWRPAEWATTIMSNELPLATLTAGTTPDVQYLGTLSALARLSGGATTPVQGTLRAQLAEAQIAHRLASRKIEHTRIGSGSVDVALEPQLVRLEANLGDGEVGTMHMNLSAQRITSRTRRHAARRRDPRAECAAGAAVAVRARDRPRLRSLHHRPARRRHARRPDARRRASR